MTELIKQKKQVPERLYSNKKLAALLIPLALDQLLNSFMGTIDTLVVSNLGSAAISAVSLVDSINILIVQAFFALASGGTVVCSHYLGCKSKDHAKEAARQQKGRRRGGIVPGQERQRLGLINPVRHL